VGDRVFVVSANRAAADANPHERWVGSGDRFQRQKAVALAGLAFPSNRGGAKAARGNARSIERAAASSSDSISAIDFL